MYNNIMFYIEFILFFNKYKELVFININIQ